MGRRNKATKPYNPWPLIILFMLPLFILAGLLLLLSSVTPRSAAEIQAGKAILQDVGEIIAESGASFTTTRAGTHIIKLPPEQALVTSSRAAKELALTTRKRTGGIVRIETPAGQVLAEAP